jgi:ketosteroid isomerase-like protein
MLLPAFLIHVSNSIDDDAKCGLDGTMKIKFVLAGYVTLFSFTFVCSVLPADTQSAIEQALRDLDAQWSAAAGAKDLEKTISFYSEDAIVLPTNAPAATTKESIRKTWKDLLASPGLAISWKTAKVDVAKSGDIAYTTGTYELTTNNASGKLVPDHGKYVEVWKKQPDGKWKVAVDIWNSDILLPLLEKK